MIGLGAYELLCM